MCIRDSYPFVLAAGATAPYDTLQDMAEHAKSNDLVLGHFGAPLVPTRVSLAYAKTAGFSWGADAAFDSLDCNTLASGDADVINTTLQLVLPCLDDIKILASITGERIPLTPDTPTMGEVVPDLNIALWNGLFVHKDTPQDVRDKIIAVARKTVTSERAQKLAADTGAAVYWQDADTSAAQIRADDATLGKIGALLE